jgi:hypothetical protein
MLCDENDEGELIAASSALCGRAVDAFDHSIGRASGDVRRAFALLTFALELLPIFMIGVPRRMSRLPLRERLAYLEALERSPVGLISMLFVAFKVPLCIPAFEDGDELRSTGFDRPTTSSRWRLDMARP